MHGNDSKAAFKCLPDWPPAGVDGLQPEVEFLGVRQRGGHQDAAQHALEARHPHVQQVTRHLPTQATCKLHNHVKQGIATMNSSSVFTTFLVPAH